MHSWLQRAEADNAFFDQLAEKYGGKKGGGSKKGKKVRGLIIHRGHDIASCPTHVCQLPGHKHCEWGKSVTSTGNMMIWHTMDQATWWKPYSLGSIARLHKLHLLCRHQRLPQSPLTRNLRLSRPASLVASSRRMNQQQGQQALAMAAAREGARPGEKRTGHRGQSSTRILRMMKAMRRRRRRVRA
jgi:hypothetical protein